MHIDTNDFVPHRCAVLPGRTHDPEGFIQTGVVLSGFDPLVEISGEAAKLLGEKVGMVRKERLEELQAFANQLSAELAVLRQRVDDIDQLKEIEVKVRQPIENGAS